MGWYCGHENFTVIPNPIAGLTDQTVIGYPSVGIHAGHLCQKTSAGVITRICNCSLKSRRINEALPIAGPNTIVFKDDLGNVSPLATASWGFHGTPFCRDSLGIIVIPDISNRNVNGFIVDIGSDGWIEAFVSEI